MAIVRSESDPPGPDGHPDLSDFERFITNAPILESFLLQAPTATILALYHTSSYLRQFLANYPTSWKYLSFRLQQPGQTTASTAQHTGTGPRQSSNYALDQLLIYIVNPFSTCLTTLELDNTAVSGQILTQTVLHLRRDTLVHLSVRGCKNVSLKYHINPWLMLYGLVNDAPGNKFAPKEFQKLALKSLYVYRCRHHRRRPYLPSSLLRKDSDSEPTHELVNICHRLGVWTDTAWCTTPGTRCYRRRGYVTMRVPQDPREVWVVYDRLWRSKNWLGTVEVPTQIITDATTRKRKRDPRKWEFDEEAALGEPLGTGTEGKALPAHLRHSHRLFMDNVTCDNCSATILERCEQCSVMMHCSGCRKTLCASCAFDRPYLRNKNAPEEDKNKFWWAPGCAISPCSMQDQDAMPIGPGMNPPPVTVSGSLVPNLKLKWCCTEPVFSGGGGITFGPGAHPDSEQIKAAPLPKNKGWEDPELVTCLHLDAAGIAAQGAELSANTFTQSASLVVNRWESIDQLFRSGEIVNQKHTSQVPRNLCDDCYTTEQWKVHCKACGLAICLKHDVQEKLKVRICGYKDLNLEKPEYRTRKKLLKFVAEIEKRTSADQMVKNANGLPSRNEPDLSIIVPSLSQTKSSGQPQTPVRAPIQSPMTPNTNATIAPDSSSRPSSRIVRLRLPVNGETPIRSSSPGSNSTAAPSRTSSPSPSDDSTSTNSESRNTQRRARVSPKISPPVWRGCQGFICPSTRPAADHRRRCVAVTRQCAQCKVHVCEACFHGIDPACPCKGCRTPASAIANGSPSTEPRFFCPNCRWERIQEGSCKHRRLSEKGGNKKKKDRLRKPVALRDSHSLIETPQGRTMLLIADDAAVYVGEFFGGVLTEDNIGVVAAGAGDDDFTAEAEQDIQELEDMGALARDLVRRIQRLRGQLRPGSLAAAALPDLRMVGESAEEVDVESGEGPLVEGMD